MNVLETLEEVEKAPQGSARLAVLKKNDSEDLRYVLKQTLSQDITFGVKKIKKQENVGALDFSQWLSGLKNILERLSRRSLTGNEALESISFFLSRCDETQAKWTERIIKQDLRVGIGLKEANKALGGVVEEFSVPLAVDYSKVKSFSGKWHLQPKLDGARCIAYLSKDGSVTLYSRTGKVWKNFESIRKQLETINKARFENFDVVLDGEVVSYVEDRINFQALQHTLFSKTKEETGKLKFFVFDLCKKEDWLSQAPVPYSSRFNEARNFVQKYITDIPCTVFKLGVVDCFETENPSIEFLEKTNETFVEKGFEGCMARKSDSFIERKRSNSLAKIKTFKDDEAEIVDRVQGTGKYTLLLGALVCKTSSGKIFEVGSGFTDEQRRLYFSKDLVGQKIVYKYQELTEDGIPRFPVFKGLRHSDDIGK